MKGKNYTVGFHRKIEGKTNYKKRLKILKARKTRLVIRKSLNNINIQFVNFDVGGDKIIASANSHELKKYNWKFSFGNIPASYLTGYLSGLKAKSKGIKEAILDLGLQSPSGRLYAALKGVLDAGVSVPHSKEIIPDEKRIFGLHITEYAKKAAGNQFLKMKPENIKNLMEDIKKTLK